MSTPTRPTVIGVDPGPTPGIGVLDPYGRTEALQTTAGVLLTVVRVLVTNCPVGEHGGPQALLAAERFVVGNRAARSSTAQAGQTTRDQVGALEALAAELGIPCRLRTASEVKRWATDARLAAVGLLLKGMPHARDAGRHTIFAAVHDAGMADPLSARSRRTSGPSR